MKKKTVFGGFRPGPTQTGLYSHGRWLEAGNFRFRKNRNCTIRLAKTKALISFAVSAKLIFAFVFIIEPHREKMGLLPMRKQRRRSASQ